MSDAARDELLRLVWGAARAWTPDNIDNVPSASRVVESGADAHDVAKAMTAASYEAVFALLLALDEGGDPNGDPTPPAWAVVALPDEQHLAGLHEDVLSADPTGREGADLND